MNSKNIILKEVELDEIELYYNILKNENALLINNSTSEEIANIIQANFKVKCSGRDVFLLHEPTLDDMILDSKIHYGLFYN